MRDFRSGIRLGENEDEYQLALREYRDYPGALVLSLTKNRQKRYTLHDANCLTISYDLAPAGDSRRKGRILFRNRTEFDAWRPNNDWIEPLNDGCQECPRRQRTRP